MSRLRRPSTLLGQAVRCRTLGDLLGEERLLRQCVAWSERGYVQNLREDHAVSTAHFYLALMGCQLGRFNEADTHLGKLGLAARLSDNIWREQPSGRIPKEFFVRAVDDGLPPALVKRVADCLHPRSPYWAEHRYDEEDVAFYSHAHYLGQELHVMDHLIEALRPLLAEVAPNVAGAVTMAEWWVHHRRPDQWHGHPLHFDTNEQLLRASKGTCLQHPAVSTVVYLSDASPRFGPTLVTNQLARAGNGGGAEMAVVVQPRLGRVLFFEGGYLHGALPGRPWLASPAEPDRRLCAMVGWWTCPLAPLPASSDPLPLMEVDPASNWVRAMQAAPEPQVQPSGPGRSLELGLLEPIWADVPTRPGGQPFFGRFFLTHRGQVDDDICN